MAHGALTIGRLSDQAGVNIQTIRYYERIGLMPAPPRSANGRRLYDADAVKRLAFVRRGRELGFSIADIRALLAIAQGEGACEDVYALTARHLEAVKAKIADLKRMGRVLARSFDQCPRDATRDCPIIESLAAD